MMMSIFSFSNWSGVNNTAKPPTPPNIPTQKGINLAIPNQKWVRALESRAQSMLSSYQDDRSDRNCAGAADYVTRAHPDYRYVNIEESILWGLFMDGEMDTVFRSSLATLSSKVNNIPLDLLRPGDVLFVYYQHKKRNLNGILRNEEPLHVAVILSAGVNTSGASRVFEDPGPQNGPREVTLQELLFEYDKRLAKYYSSFINAGVLIVRFKKD